MIIHAWGLPRALTTATMYSFNQREDCDVYDEPLYAHYLRLHPEQSRPYREELLRSAETDGNEVLRAIIARAESTGKIQYLKHITKFHQDLDTSLLFKENSVHILLLRNPINVIQSWDQNRDKHVVPSCAIDDVGFPDLMRIYLQVRPTD